MHPRSLWTQGDVCWRCQWRLRTQSLNIRPSQTDSRGASRRVLLPSPRALHRTAQRYQSTAAPATSSPSFNPLLVPRPPKVAIRNHLAQWHEDHGGPTEEALSAFGNHPLHDGIQNGLSKLSSFGRTADDITGTRGGATMNDDKGDDMITIGLFMKPGDVVELSQPGSDPVLAVFVQQLENSSQFFSVNGRWAHSLIARVAFAITGCIDPALVKTLVPYLPTDPSALSPKSEIQVPPHLAAPVTNILERMTDEAEQIYRTNASVLDNAYASLADQERTRMMTLGQIAKSLLAKDDRAWKPSPAALLAVRKALNHNEYRFRTDRRSHRLTNVFSIRPKDEVHVVETVHGWIREYFEHLAMSANATDKTRKPSTGVDHIIAFLSKVRRLIAISRKDRDPTVGSIGPSKAALSRTVKSKGMQIVWDEPFTHAEKQIIQFIQAWALTNQFSGNDGLSSACTDLVRATECYGEGVMHHAEGIGHEALEVKNSTGALFLQEIGVTSPFENRMLYDEQLMLPTIKLSRNLELLRAKAERIRLKPDFHDSMAGLRRDWGSTTIYCIDPAGALEIDDGISIERVLGSASEYWVHIHVANATAFFNKTHTLSGLAAHMTATIYLPERVYPMQPSWLTQEYFSIERDRPVLTFSSRVDGDGNVLETKIQPGTAREIVTITPNEVATLLGHESKSETRSFTVGGESPNQEEPRKVPSLSAAQLQDLQDLNTVAKGLWNKRKNAGGMYINNRYNQVHVSESSSRKGLPWTPPSTDRSRRVRGDPIIKVTHNVIRDLFHFEYTPARIVEEAMILACSSAATWCSERHVPVIYRGTIEMPKPEGTPSSKEILTKTVHPLLEKYGKVPYSVAIYYLESISRAISHYAPIPHQTIGVGGYVRVTSPLRRFTDMIAHWQIEAVLRYEARHGKKFNGQTSSSGRDELPFSQRQITDSIVTLTPREALIATTQAGSRSFWGLLALGRALYFHETSLPDTFRCVVRHSDETKTLFAKVKGAIGYLLDYGYDVIILESEDLKAGDQLHVRVERVDVFGGTITVRPLELLSREEGLS